MIGICAIFLQCFIDLSLPQPHHEIWDMKLKDEYCSSECVPLPNDCTSLSFPLPYAPSLVPSLPSPFDAPTPHFLLPSFSPQHLLSLFTVFLFCPFLLSCQVLTPTSIDRTCPFTTHASTGWDATRYWRRMFALRRYTAALVKQHDPVQFLRLRPCRRIVSWLTVEALWGWVPRYPRTADTKKTIL